MSALLFTTLVRVRLIDKVLRLGSTLQGVFSKPRMLTGRLVTKAIVACLTRKRQMQDSGKLDLVDLFESSSGSTSLQGYVVDVISQIRIDRYDNQ